MNLSFACSLRMGEILGLTWENVHISDEDIVGLNLPTAVPYVFDFDNDLRLINDYFLGDPEEIKKLMEAVAKQGQKK